MRKDGGSQLKKCCWMLFLSLSAAGSVFAQGTSENAAPPNIDIVKLGWKREVRLPRNFDPSVIPTGDTFRDPASRSSGPPSSIDATRVASPPRYPVSSSNITFPASPGRLPVFYIYSLKIRNVGAKAIEGIAWDYLFIDPNSNTELGRHQFLSYAKAAKDKSIGLQAQLRSPPVRVVRASGQKTHPKLIEREVIECVLYADATVWTNPAARPGVCELLKNERVLLKRHRGAGQP